MTQTPLKVWFVSIDHLTEDEHPETVHSQHGIFTTEEKAKRYVALHLWDEINSQLEDYRHKWTEQEFITAAGRSDLHLLGHHADYDEPCLALKFKFIEDYDTLVSIIDTFVDYDLQWSIGEECVQ